MLQRIRTAVAGAGSPRRAVHRMRYNGRELRRDSRMGEGTQVPRLPCMPGIDGLRALAVAAVFLYHAAPSWLPGGFFGVDVFFVISGYLITSLLLAELDAT